MVRARAAIRMPASSLCPAHGSTYAATAPVTCRFVGHGSKGRESAAFMVMPAQGGQAGCDEGDLRLTA